MKTDMSPKAVTMRLKLTSELRRLCLALGRRERESGAEQDSGPKTHKSRLQGRAKR